MLKVGWGGINNYQRYVLLILNMALKVLNRFLGLGKNPTSFSKIGGIFIFRRWANWHFESWGLWVKTTHALVGLVGGYMDGRSKVSIFLYFQVCVCVCVCI